MIADIMYYKTGIKGIKHKYIYSSSEMTLDDFKKFISQYINTILEGYTTIITYYMEVKV